MVFDAAFLKRLEALRLAVRRFVGGPREGERPGVRRGGASVYHSTRSYVQGDDFRSIDWNLYARFESFFVRERTRDEAPVLHAVLDTSPSMSFGSPTKVDFARRLLAAVGYLAAGEGGDVTLWTGPRSRTFRGAGSVHEFLEAVEGADGGGRPAESLARIDRPGFVMVASDLWDDGLTEALGSLGAGRPLTILHLLSREELDPPWRGRVRFEDAEGRGAVTRFIEEEEIARYRGLVEEHVREWRAWAGRREVSYVRCASDEPFEEVCLVYLRGEGVLE